MNHWHRGCCTYSLVLNSWPLAQGTDTLAQPQSWSPLCNTVFIFVIVLITAGSKPPSAINIWHLPLLQFPWLHSQPVLDSINICWMHQWMKEWMSACFMPSAWTPVINEPSTCISRADTPHPLAAPLPPRPNCTKSLQAAVFTTDFYIQHVDQSRDQCHHHDTFSSPALLSACSPCWPHFPHLYVSSKPWAHSPQIRVLCGSF